MHRVSVVRSLCAASRSDTLWHIPQPPNTHTHNHANTYICTHGTHQPSFSHEHTHTSPHPPCRQWFYVPCRHPVLSHFLLVCHTVSLPLLYPLCLPIHSLALFSHPSIQSITAGTSFHRSGKKQLKAIDPDTHSHVDAHEYTYIWPHAHTTKKPLTGPWICRWVSLTFKERGKPGDFILHGSPVASHTHKNTHTQVIDRKRCLRHTYFMLRVSVVHIHDI